MAVEQSPGMAVGRGSTVPFRHWVIDDWGTPIDPAELPPFDSPFWEAHYENDTEQKKHTSRFLTDMAPGLQSQFDRLRGGAESWSERLGYSVWDDPTLHGGGLHVTEPGGWLNTHLDYDLHPKVMGSRRALNLILFLNPEWNPEWGGALLLSDPLGRVVSKVYPSPGRLVAFEVGDLSYHGVEPVQTCVNPLCKRHGVSDLNPLESLPCQFPPRITAAVYYLSAAGSHNTRQRALFVPKRG